MVLFLANFPEEATISEGMSQRMIAIDEQAQRHERTYLFVSHRLFWKMESVEIKPGVIQYRCNLFRHFFFIRSLLREADAIYIHSVIHLLPLLPAWLIVRKHAHIILDAHGVVPEEHLLAGISWKSKAYDLSERILFNRVDVAVVVSKAMERHFREKYPRSPARYITHYILPIHVIQDGYTPAEQQLDVIRVVYSGNAQKWQNIELMISIIKKNLSERIQYDILTGDLKQMNAYLRNAGLDNEKSISVAKVSPQELSAYYARAHYGFVLRDDIVINRVACPTKLVEYLYYGITPIVISPYIGDFMEMGYEYLKYDLFSSTVEAKKSVKNHFIVEQLQLKNHVLDFENIISG
ncbi:glycosyltransferase [Parapedobacter sp. DT-150]|uniref:glycosyltransferase n=1 Tax=Parapedobacter sp. DT-150 TaxID=3396162 RepID=UPI003F1BF887